MNYAQLVAAIESYTENQFETTDIDTFIKEAEQRVYNSVQLPALRKNVTGNLTSGNKYLACPSDWLATFSLALINGNNEFTYLLDKDVNFIRASYPDTDAAYYGTPEYYAQFDQNTFILGPTPDASYNMELHYFYYPESIVAAGTSWLGDNFDTALLNGCLVEAARFMKAEQDIVTIYDKLYAQSIALLKQLGDGKQRMDAYRDGQVRDKVS